MSAAVDSPPSCNDAELSLRRRVEDARFRHHLVLCRTAAPDEMVAVGAVKAR